MTKDKKTTKTPGSKGGARSELENALEEARDLILKAQWVEATTLLGKHVENRPKDDRSKSVFIKVLLVRAFALTELSDLDGAEKDSLMALAHSRELKDTNLEGEALRQLANVTWKKGDIKKAQRFLDDAQAIAKKFDYERLKGLVHLERGTIFCQTTRLDLAEREYRDAILSLEKAGDLQELARAYNNLGCTVYFTKDYERGVEIFSKARKIAQRAGYSSLISWGAINLAVCLYELGRFKEAQEELDIALPILERSKDTVGILSVYETNGLIYAKTKEWEKAEIHLFKGLALAQRSGMPLNEGRAFADIAKMYMWQGNKTEARRNLKKALDILDKLGAKTEADKVREDMKDLS
jgi:tetratricopeptide (TPR) repeat protein